MFILAKSFTNKKGEMFLKIFPRQYPSIETAHAAMQSDYQEELKKRHLDRSDEEATHGYVKYDKSMIVSKDETTVNRIADMLDSMGFDAVTGYFDPEEDKRSGEVDSLTGYYYVDI